MINHHALGLVEFERAEELGDAFEQGLWAFEAGVGELPPALLALAMGVNGVDDELARFDPIGLEVPVVVLLLDYLVVVLVLH